MEKDTASSSSSSLTELAEELLRLISQTENSALRASFEKYKTEVDRTLFIKQEIVNRLTRELEIATSLIEETKKGDPPITPREERRRSRNPLAAFGRRASEGLQDNFF